MSVKSSPKNLRFAVLAADITLFTLHDGCLLVRVVRVDRSPHFVNYEALPGGLLRPSETAEQAVSRLLGDKAGIAKGKVYVEQLYTFSRLDRDPRGRVVAVAYLALVPYEELSEGEREANLDVRWSPVGRVRKLAYDHNEMLTVALARLRSRATYTTLLQKLMPKEFTLTELENAYESVLGKSIDKRNFRKKILATGVLEELSKIRAGMNYRPARLYRFKLKKVKEVVVL